MKCFLGIFNFLEDISSLSCSVVFFYFFALVTEKGFRVSLLAILWNSAFKWVYLSFLLCLSLLFFSQLFVRPPQRTIFSILDFFFLEMVLITASCKMSWTSVHSSSGTLSDLIPWIYWSGKSDQIGTERL